MQTDRFSSFFELENTYNNIYFVFNLIVESLSYLAKFLSQPFPNRFIIPFQSNIGQDNCTNQNS